MNSLQHDALTTHSLARVHAHEAYHAVRSHSLALAAPLSAEDQCLQSMTEASPCKWHLAHTSWFFEALLLIPFLPHYRPFDEQYLFLFNSYYEALGPRLARPSRGLISRPSLEDVHLYRRHIDASMHRLMDECTEEQWEEIQRLMQLGINHEQQHQELILTDILHAFWCNPLKPAYDAQYSYPGPEERAPPRPAVVNERSEWADFTGGRVSVGCPASDQAGAPFCYDNETPRHDVLLLSYQLGTRLVSCAEFAAFIDDGGYRKPELWLSEGWAAVQAHEWKHPAYWIPDGPSDWKVFGLRGVEPLDGAEPVMQLSFYEAAAYAEWAGARLPTEFEWEAAAHDVRLTQVAGHAWQWTRSSYDPYPGFRPMAGAPSEYNGKFMVGQLVLRGGSHATPSGHTRPTYRNFFPPGARWQFSGLRLARDLTC